MPPRDRGDHQVGLLPTRRPSTLQDAPRSRRPRGLMRQDGRLATHRPDLQARFAPGLAVLPPSPPLEAGPDCTSEGAILPVSGCPAHLPRPTVNPRPRGPDRDRDRDGPGPVADPKIEK